MDELEKKGIGEKENTEEQKEPNFGSEPEAEVEVENESAQTAQIEDSQTAEETETTDSGDELNNELEQIRDMFQTELDKVSADESESENESELLIQELDEIEEEVSEDESSESTQEDLCQCCGENIRDTSFGDDYPYCSDCRELMKANPLNSLGILAVIFMIFVAGFSISRFAVNVSDFETLLDANDAYNSGYYIDAASKYQSYFSSVDTSDGISIKAAKNLADVYASIGYYSYAQSAVESYLPASLLKLPWNQKYTEYSEKYEAMQEAQTLVTDNFYDVLSGEDFDYDEEIEKADKLIEEYKESEDCGPLTLDYLEYVKYIIMSRNGDSYEKQLEQLKIVEETDAGSLPLLYYSDILSIYGKMGDIENAKIYFDKSMEINRQDAYSYSYYADAYRYCEAPDADKILEIAQQAATTCSSSSLPTYYKIYAIAYLLQGNYEDAYSSFEQYLQYLSSYGSSAGVADYNLYALCASAAGDSDTYDQIKSLFESSGLSINSLVEKFNKGKITIEKVLSDNGGEIG